MKLHVTSVGQDNQFGSEWMLVEDHLDFDTIDEAYEFLFGELEYGDETDYELNGDYIYSTQDGKTMFVYELRDDI